MSLFTADTHYTGPPLTAALVRNAERELGYALPRSYLAVLHDRNGGVLRARCHPTSFPTSWADDHFEVTALRGIGGEQSIDGPFGSRYLIGEWDYPDIGVVFCDTPSAGHDTVMLDYTNRGADGEPAVSYIDEDRVPRLVAPNFAAFVAALRADSGWG